MKKLHLSDGMMLALVPAAAWFMAYTYECGYFGFFGAPRDLIYVDAITLLSFAVAVLAMFSGLYWTVDWIRLMFLESQPPYPWSIRGSLSLVLGFFCLWILFAVIVDFEWIEALPLPASITGLRFLRGCQNQFRLPETLSRNVFLLLISLMLFVAVPNNIGWGMAHRQWRFCVLSDQPGSFIVRRMGDRVLLGFFDEKTKTVSNKFRITTLAEIKTTIELQVIGPLRPSQSANWQRNVRTTSNESQTVAPKTNGLVDVLKK